MNTQGTMKLNDLLRQQGEPMFYTPFDVWVQTIQPDASHAMANPPYNTI